MISEAQGKTFEAIIGDLNALSGTLWKEVKAEIHEQYAEFPVWILLYTDYNIHSAHNAVRRIILPHVEAAKPLKITISYNVIEGSQQGLIDFLVGHDEIASDIDLEREIKWLPLKAGNIFSFNSSAHEV